MELMNRMTVYVCGGKYVLNAYNILLDNYETNHLRGFEESKIGYFIGSKWERMSRTLSRNPKNVYNFERNSVGCSAKKNHLEK